MATGFKFKVIVPEEINTRKMSRILEKELDKFAEEKLKKDFDSSHKDFRHKLETKIKKGKRKKLSRIVSVSDKAYFFVSHGTKKRWAIMSSGFKSKTIPSGRIASRKGRGRAVLIGKRAMQRRGIPPRPGIEGRKFDFRIARKRKSEFRKDMSAAMGVSAKNAFDK